MPAFNASHTISGSIDSVLHSTHTNLELLIVDDHSSDDTRGIALARSRRDSRVRVLSTDRTAGPAEARNVATREARGSYIAFCDADDLWHPRKLERQLAHMREHAAILCGTAFVRINDQGQRISSTLFVPHRITIDDMLRTNLLCCSSVVYDVARAGKLSMPDYRTDPVPWYLAILKTLPTHEDYLTWLALLISKPSEVVAGLNEPLTFYRVSGQSTSANKFKAALVRWHIYRNILRIPHARAGSLFLGYAMDALRRRR
jgi:teichuronic acid biosynthesis glycosyltransferase TuaG